MLIKNVWSVPISLPHVVDIRPVALLAPHRSCTPLVPSYFGLRSPFTGDVSFPAWEFILSKG